MPLYKVKLSYPTVLVIRDKTYHLFPGKEIELPSARTAQIVKTYLKLGYLEPVKHKKKTEKAKEVKEAEKIEKTGNPEEGGK